MTRYVTCDFCGEMYQTTPDDAVDFKCPDCIEDGEYEPSEYGAKK